MADKVLRHDVGEGGVCHKKMCTIVQENECSTNAGLPGYTLCWGIDCANFNCLENRENTRRRASQTFANWNLAKEKKKKSSTNNSCNQS